MGTTRTSVTALLLGAIIVIGVIVAVPPAAAADADQSAASDPVPKDLVLKGDAKCTACHDDPDLLGIGKTRHGGVAKATQLTCTSCHGDSESHIKKPAETKPDRIFGKKAPHTTADDRSQACLT